MARKIDLIIYGLIDPRTRNLRYVGKSKHGFARLRAHVLQAQHPSKPKFHVHHWINTLISEGLRPEIVLIERLDPESNLIVMRELERWYVLYFRGQGCDLANSTDGGDGTEGYKYSAESRAKMRKAKLGTKRTLESRERQKQNACRGSANPSCRPEVRAKLVAKNLRYWEEVRQGLRPPRKRRRARDA